MPVQHTINTQTFGIEVEFGGLSRNRAIQVIAGHFGISSSRIEHGNNDSYFVKDSQNRKWQIVYDGSVNSQGGEACELVSPPLKYEDDIETVQEIVRKLKAAGAKVDSSCGIHIHIGLQDHSFRSIRNLIKYYAKYEHFLYKAVKVISSRERYAQKITTKHTHLLNNIDRVTDLEGLKNIWYHGSGISSHKYNNSRYCGLNLHNIWFKGWYSGTIEFRLFNATLHAGKIRSYIVLCLALGAKALNAQQVNSRQARIVDDLEIYHKVLLSLGINKNDDVMKNVYKHLYTDFEEQTRQASGN